MSGLERGVMTLRIPGLLGVVFTLAVNTGAVRPGVLLAPLSWLAAREADRACYLLGGEPCSTSVLPTAHTLEEESPLEPEVVADPSPTEPPPAPPAPAPPSPPEDAPRQEEPGGWRAYYEGYVTAWASVTAFAERGLAFAGSVVATLTWVIYISYWCLVASCG